LIHAFIPTEPVTASNPENPVNPGTHLDPGWMKGAPVPDEILDDRLRDIWTTFPSKMDEVTATKALRSMDLTSLSSDDTPEVVRRLCRQGRDPLGFNKRGGPMEASRREAGRAPSQDPEGVIRVAAVCVHFPFIPVALDVLEGSGVPVATVGGAFPHGLTPLPARLLEIRSAVEAGAREVDVVIRRDLALTERWEELYQELSRFREAVGGATLKVILATGELGDRGRVALAARIALMAGADFLKTSTGKERVNATFPEGLVMLNEIQEYRRRTGIQVGFKAAGGIRTQTAANRWIHLAASEMGDDFICPKTFRIGASSLLNDLLEHWPGVPE
jgi:deoxyribose-phosphate aldolase